MNIQQLDEERIFQTARLLPTSEAIAVYLDQVCAGDRALRERVEALLKVHEEALSFLKSAQPTVAPTVDLGKSLERAGVTIGRYKLMEQLGEGGMGTVFVAQQERPIRRKVALKLIKPGMDIPRTMLRRSFRHFKYARDSIA